uniref:Methionine synthase reductase n=1 Tax=Leptobrachium leishanense TaxID=445787 RepID=A0A8C5PAB0_9ANUR
MCGALKRRFLLLYGTQQGQAKAIAEEIGQQADQHGLVADVHSLKDINKFNLEKERDPVIFIVSTTGTGDPPDQALKFVKKIKNKELPEDHFAHLRYGLLALGDSEYTYFCNGGKIIDRRLQELGAKHFYETGHADDCVGLELVVDPWLEGLWLALKKEVELRKDNQDMNTQTRDMASTDQETPDALGNLNLQIQAISLETSVLSHSSSEAAQSETSKSITPSLIHSASTLSQCSLNVPALPPPFLEVLVEDCEGQESDSSSLYPEEKIFKVPISNTQRLTAEDAVKTTLLLELDISDTDLQLQPGASFSIICPNPSSEVHGLLVKLGLTEKKNFQVSVEVKSNTKKRVATIPKYIPEKCSLEFMLTWCLEIRSVPKKAFLRSLVEHTPDPAEKRRLQELCSKQGSADYNQFVRDGAISILDILSAFPSCKPPLRLLIEHLPKLQARPYSAASSNLFHPGKLQFVFNVVELPICSEHSVPRKGVCTGWLSDQVFPIGDVKSDPLPEMGHESDRNLIPKISIFARPSTSFGLPADTSVPIIMVGPGTGIAPFIGFLQHRLKLKESDQKLKFGDAWLFFGCRHRDKDYLFRDEFSNFIENGVLTYLKVCFSRETSDHTDQSAPQYVQDSLRLYSQDIVRILTRDNGRIYICGDAKNMARDVNDALADIFSMELGLDKLEAMKTLAGLRDHKQYLQDVWS